MTVHPRGRGEQARANPHLDSMVGSSPRTRGTAAWTSARRWIMRFIPADAGNSLSGYGAGRRLTVHPRGRGEQAVAKDKSLGNRGSSPRTRGTENCLSNIEVQPRFIPADAGNRLPWFG